MTITARCRRRDCAALATRAANELPVSWPCPVCGAELRDGAANPWQHDGRVACCPCCGGREFFVRKDFPQKIGLAIVIVAGLIGFGLMVSDRLGWAVAVLGGVVALDSIVYLFVGRVTTCYRCRCEFRGAAVDPNHHGFDLATAEKYSQAAD